MGIRLPGTVLANAKKVLCHSMTKMSSFGDVPRGFFAVYVGESQKKRFVVPVSYLQQPLFQELLDKAEEEFGFNHPMGGLTIPCREDTFLQVTSLLNRLRQKRA